MTVVANAELAQSYIVQARIAFILILSVIIHSIQ